MQVVKRDCSLVDFDEAKIFNAIMKAMKMGQELSNLLSQNRLRKKLKQSVEKKQMMLIFLQLNQEYF